MNSIKEWREEHGLEPMPAGYDIRTMIETVSSKTEYKNNKVSSNEVRKLKEAMNSLEGVLKDSELYKKYKIERRTNIEER